MSTVKFDTWQNTDGTENYKCRAWCRFDGTAADITSTMTGGNVSSITDNGAGDYTVNFTTAMTDINYSVVHSGGLKAITWGLPIGIGLSGAGTSNNKSTTQTRIGLTNTSDILNDTSNINVAIFR